MYLMVDNYDSFVYNLACYLQECGEQVELVRNDKITAKEIERMLETGNLEGVVISPILKVQKIVGIAGRLWKSWLEKSLFWGYVWDIRL